MNPAENAVTWIKVERPIFDLVGVIISSFELTGLLLLAAVGLGGLLGLSLIYHRRRPGPPPLDAVSLHLDVIELGGAASHRQGIRIAGSPGRDGLARSGCPAPDPPLATRASKHGCRSRDASSRRFDTLPRE